MLSNRREELLTQVDELDAFDMGNWVWRQRLMRLLKDVINEIHGEKTEAPDAKP